MDEFYIEKVLNGDHRSFQYFITSYKSYVFSLSFSVLKDKYLAEDVTQEAFIKAYKSLRSFKGNSSFRTWIGRIVINEALRKAKKERRYDAEEIPPEDFSSNSADKISNLEKDEQRYYISLVFEKIPPEQSLALELFYLKEMSVAEIIALTDWSSSKTKMLLQRGRKTFYYNLKSMLKSEVREIL
ncbi:RNA polymerase sigma factor [Marinoscillum sp. MHG1-6]|uniref:RNA polymerase sigma factor n=1 Tax=Marinoscillum sp. MHG1-6 TaxID=2959627 RepID=UPI0021571B4F|nr:RNA polymerase sigma factor [Marinoscillum sp. MHG1-6]